MPSNRTIPEQKMVDARFLRDEFGMSELAIGRLLADERTAAADITEWLLKSKADPLKDVPVPDLLVHIFRITTNTCSSPWFVAIPTTLVQAN